MPFLAKASSDGRPHDLAAASAARGFAGLHAGRPRGIAGDGFAAIAIADRFLEAAPGDCLSRHAGTGLVCLADARLDDADGLAGLLPGPPGRSPAALIADAYLTFGPDFAPRIRGDYAALLWDPRDRTLLLLADRACTRGLYYMTGGGGTTVATELRVLLADEDAPAEPDPERLALWMANPATVRADHLYPGIRQVLPGHLVILGPGGERAQRYWDPAAAPDLRFRRKQDYEDAAAALLETAVRRRLPARLKAGCQLSGGLDSPLVAGTAARLLEERGKRLATFTWVHTDPSVPGLWRGRYWDEHRAAADFARRFPAIDPVEVPTDSAGALDGLDTIILSWGQPGGPSLSKQAAGHALALAAKARGVGIMLTGYAGNETLSQGGGGLLPELLLRGRLPALLRHWAALRRNGVGLDAILGKTLLGILPSGLGRFLREATGRAPPPLDQVVPLSRAFTADPAWRSRVAGEAEAWKPRYTPRAIVAQLAGFSFAAENAWYRVGHGIDLRHPLADADLMEFCAGLPQDQYLDEGEDRHLARRLLRRLGAPEALLRERRRGEQLANWQGQLMRAMPGIRAELEALETSPAAARLLDLPRLRHLLDELPRAEPTRREDIARFSTGIGMAVGAGRFLRRAERGNGGPVAAPPVRRPGRGGRRTGGGG